MTHHNLKCHPHFFNAFLEGKKTFEIRRNDRQYRIGDTFTLQEYDPSFGYTQRETGPFEIAYLMNDEDFPGIRPGFVIMGLHGLPQKVVQQSAKSIGEIVDETPVVKWFEKCNEYRMRQGLPIKRTCELCKYKPCLVIEAGIRT